MRDLCVKESWCFAQDEPLEEPAELTDEEIADLHPEWSGSLVTRVRQG